MTFFWSVRLHRQARFINCIQCFVSGRYLGLVLIRYSNTQRRENDCPEGRSFLYLQILRNRGQSTAQRPRGAGAGPGQLRSRVGGKKWARAFVVVSMGRSRQAGHAGLGLASLNNFCRIWSVDAVLVAWSLALR